MISYKISNNLPYFNSYMLKLYINCTHGNENFWCISIFCYHSDHMKKMRHLIVFQSLLQNLTMIKLFDSTWIRIYKIYKVSLTVYINVQRYKSSKFLHFYDIIPACNTIFDSNDTNLNIAYTHSHQILLWFFFGQVCTSSTIYFFLCFAYI